VESSARSTQRGGTPATGGVEVLEDVVVDACADDGRLLADEPQPTTASAPEIATAAVTGTREWWKGTALHSVSGGSRDSGRDAIVRRSLSLAAVILV
jgi:hypothetical protein